jgi:hypothetical protein
MNLLRMTFAWLFRRRRLLVPFALLLGAVATWYPLFLARRDRLLVERDGLLAALIAKGETATFREYEKLARADDPGLRHLMRAVLATGRETALGYQSPRKTKLNDAIHRLVGDTMLPSPGLVPGDWAAIEAADEPKADVALTAALAKLDPAFSELEKACVYPPALFPHDFGTPSPFSIHLSQVQDLRLLAKACRAAACVAIAKNDPRRAWRFVTLGFKLAERLDSDVFHISKLVQCQLFTVACKTMTMTLGHFEPTPEEFAALDDVLAAADRVRFGASVRGEQAATIRHLEINDPEEWVAFMLRGPRSDIKWLRLVARYQTSRLGEPDRIEDQVWLARTLDRRVAAVDDLGPSGAAALVEHEADLARQGGYSFAARMMPPLDKLRDGHRRLRLEAEAARGCLRINRFRAVHDRWPSALAEVACADWPSASSALLFGASGPRYERTASGFRLRHSELKPVGMPAPNPWGLEVRYPPGRLPKPGAKS